MTTQNHNWNRLSARQRHILEHVRRQRLSTNEVIQKIFFDEQHPSAVTRATSTLTKLGWLNSFPLVYPTKYYRLGKRGAAAFGVSPQTTYPFGPQSLPTEYAVLRYTTANDDRRRLLATELDRKFPWFPKSWKLATYCEWNIKQKSVLQLIRVDLGGAPDDIARKCAAEIENRWLHPQFRELVQQGQFQLVVLTATTEKSARIQSALAAHQWPTGIKLRLGTFPDLLPLLPGTF